MGTRGSRIALSCHCCYRVKGGVSVRKMHARSGRKQKRPHRPVDDRSRREAITPAPTPLAFATDEPRAR